ncbi:hypothetical protein ABPG74_011795 [Tetrahymena malaccensis]
MIVSRLFNKLSCQSYFKQLRSFNLIQTNNQNKKLTTGIFSNFATSDDKKISFYFVNKDGKQVEVKAKEGENILEIAHQNEIDLEGACEMSLACSTCHVILEDKIYNNIDSPTMEEEDLLDLAYGLTDTSRLGCQVKVSKQFEGTKITLPKATRNFYVDGHKPKPH